MKKLIIIFLIIIINSCSTHQINSYNLTANTLISINKKKYNKTLLVKYPSALEALGSSRIFYKKGNITSYYLYSKWTTSLTKIIYKELIKTLEKSHKYKNIISYESSANADLILETQIIDFYHIVDKNPYAKISFKVNLIDANNGKIIKSKIFNYKIALKENSAQAFVMGAKEAINLFLKDLVAML